MTRPSWTTEKLATDPEFAEAWLQEGAHLSEPRAVGVADIKLAKKRWAKWVKSLKEST